MELEQPVLVRIYHRLTPTSRKSPRGVGVPSALGKAQSPVVSAENSAKLDIASALFPANGTFTGAEGVNHGRRVRLRRGEGCELRGDANSNTE